MASLVLPELPTSPMFINGILSVEWQEFFRSLYDRVGGVDATNLNDIATLILSGIYSTDSGEITKRIDNIRNLLHATPQASNIQNRLDNIEKKLAAIDQQKNYDAIVLDIKRSILSELYQPKAGLPLPLRLPGSGDNYFEIGNDGFLSFAENARYKQILQIGAGAAQAPGLKPATYVAHGIDGAWEFVKNLDKEISLNFAPQRGIDRNENLVFLIGWSSPAIVGDVKWEIQYLWRKNDEDTNSIAPDETLTAIDTVSTTAHGYVYSAFYPTVPPDDDDRYAALKIARLGSDAADTADDVAHYVGIAIYFVYTELGDHM